MAARTPSSGSGRNRAKRIGEIRSSQVITTYGPGALLDLPRHSVIVAGLGTWRPRGGAFKQHLGIDQPRLAERTCCRSPLSGVVLGPAS